MPLIVVVDDRVTNRALLARLSASLDENARVEAFGDPAQALEWTHTHTPDLVVTDYKMPGMNGAEFIRRFRQHPPCQDVPLIVVTAYEDRGFRYEALNAGATDYLLSPVDRQEFQARSHNLLLLRRQQLIIKNRAKNLERKLATSDRLHAEVLRETEEKLRRVIDTVPAMISAVDSQSRYVFMNRYQAELFRVDSDTSVGHTVEELVGGDYADRSSELDRETFARGETMPSYEETFVDADGERRTMLTTKSPLLDSVGRVTNVVTVSLDISDRKRAEEILREAKDEAELANRTKTEFLANMSHELRTPLNAIIGFADIISTELLGPVGSAKYREYSRDIGDSARHLLSIINDILDVSKIEAGKLELHEDDLDVKGLIGDVLRLIKERARLAGVHLEANVGADLPPFRGDARKLKQILLNLLSNAVKFTPYGGLVRINADLMPSGGLRMLVADTGIGIAEADIPIATARFGQVDSSMTRRYSGTGLGLPLSLGLVQLHGGQLSIESKIGHGTQVTVTFPAQRTIPAQPLGAVKES